MQPNAPATLRKSSIFYFRGPQAIGDAALALLDLTGDLRQLDLIVENLNVAKTSLRTDWKLLPNGQQAKAWARTPGWRLPGRRRWLYEGSPNNPGGIDPALYGTDLSQNNVLHWHAHIARCTLALKNNRGKKSPQRHDYGQQYEFWRSYLLDDFEQLWSQRNNLNFDRSMYRSLMAALAYSRAMYLLENRARDNSTVVTLTGWRQNDEVTQTHEGVTIRAASIFSVSGEANAGESHPKPYAWQLTNVTHYTHGHSYHLYLMGSSGFNDSYMTGLANNLYYCTFIDGPGGDLAVDVGGGGIPFAGATRTQLRTRDGGQYGARHALAGQVKARYSARTALGDGLWLPVRFGSSRLADDLTAMRNRFSPLQNSNTPLDKAALCIAHLVSAGYRRDDGLPSSPDPGGPQNPEPPPYYAPTDPPDLRRYFFFEDVDVAERIPDFTLLPDRVDYDPGDPLQPPEASLPALYPNELINYVRLLGNAVNQLIDERGTGGAPPPDTGGGGGGGEFTAWPDSFIRTIFWGLSGQPTSLGNPGEAQMLFVGGAAVTEDGIKCSRGTNPQYVMSTPLAFDLSNDFVLLSVVKDAQNAGDLAAYCAAASQNFNDGYVQVQQLGSDLQGVYRTLGSNIWAKTLDSPAQPLPMSGAGWRMVKLAKLGDSFAITNVNRLALGDTPNKARLSFASGTGQNFPKGTGGGVRIGAGIVPRVQPGTGIIGTGNFTVGALVLVPGAMTDVQTADWYNAFRNAQIAAGLSTVLTAPAV